MLIYMSTICYRPNTTGSFGIKGNYSKFALPNHKVTQTSTKSIKKEKNTQVCKTLRKILWDSLCTMEDTHNEFQYFF